MEKSIKAKMPSLTKTSLSLAVLVALSAPVHASDDYNGLQALIEATTQNNSSPLESLPSNSWNNDNQCSWHGVTCGPTGAVTKVDVENLGLVGVIPEDIKLLSNLETLNLSDNDFEGEIPEEIGLLLNLTELNLNNNELEGEVPESIADLVNINNVGQRGIDLRYNKLEDSSEDETSQFIANVDSDWLDYQTVAPEDLTSSAKTTTSLTLNWTPITYQTDGGYYEIVISKDATIDEGFDEFVQTDDKTDSSIIVRDLEASSNYYYAIRTITDRPDATADELVSEFSDWFTDHTLLDSDGDGTPDVNDSDDDNDGLSDELEGEEDSDGDGLIDALENNYRDTDSDGKPDHLDDDDDGDGILTSVELGNSPGNPPDTDGDGIPNYLDLDSSNSGGMSDGSGDSDGDGRSDTDECGDPPLCVDSDGDNIPDYLDDDDDNDGFKSINETWSLDSDSDGIIDALEPNNMDYDGDGIKNYLDPDDDGDGTPTVDEYGGDYYDPIDEDEDGIPDYLDKDSDNDADTDDESGDSDGDGVTDMEECPNAPKCVDANNNGIPGYLDVNEEIAYAETGVLGDGSNRDDVTTGGGGSTGLLGLLLGLPLLRRRKR